MITSELSSRTPTTLLCIVVLPIIGALTWGVLWASMVTLDSESLCFPGT